MARRAEKNGESESTRTLNYKFHEMKETRTKAAGLINKSTRGEIFKLKVISTPSKTYKSVIILKKTTQLVMF